MIAEIKCKHCGGIFEDEILAKNTFCPHCGKATPAVPVQATPARQIEGRNNKPSRLQTFSILAVVIAVMVIVAVAIFNLPKKEQVIANKVVEPEQSLITGQIFIVTKGRENVVLGDEKVALLSAQEARVYFNSKALDWSNALAIAQITVDQATANYDALYKDELAKLDADNKNQENIIQTVPTTSQEWDDAFARSKVVEGEIRDLHKLKKSAAEKNQLDDAISAQADLWDKINWPSADYFEPSIATTTTDSEGRFKFIIPKSTADANMMLLAKAERELGVEKEKYWWTVNVNLNGHKTDDFILSNDNKDDRGVWGWFDDKPTQDYMINYTVKMDAAKSSRDFEDRMEAINDDSDALPSPRTLEEIRADLEGNGNKITEQEAEQPAQIAAQAAQIAAQIAQAQAAQAAAVKFNQDLADKGDAYGMLRMGERYRDGDGVPKDLNKARDYLTKAAAAGSPSAADELSKLNQVSPNSPAIQ
jgi:hypothetical protein